jgi:23S rRNA G2069 N7-methylase RlmK/C1962 C5-methylase RlmI
MGKVAGTRAAAEPEKTSAQAEMLENRLRKRRRHLRKWAGRMGTGAYRLYDRDIPEIPLVLDLYGDAVSGALYKRPYEKDAAEEARWLNAMKAAVSSALDIPPDHVFLKERQRQRGKDQYGAFDRRGFFRDVEEGGLVFRVNLSDYLDTGLFPDRRLLRALIREESGGKRVLNLFAYTCSFSVYAAAGGAASVDSLDLSRVYLDWGMLNFALNGFKGEAAAETCGGCLSARGGGAAGIPRFRFIRDDAQRFLPEAKRAGRRWDLIILDPPAFSNSKKMRGSFDLKRDYRGMVRDCLGLLAPGGRLFVSVNARSFSLDGAAFPEATLTDLTEKLRDEDFAGKRAPACWMLEE